jgi:uncharacterized repeat protein (TIGR02543 family)
MRLLHTLSGSPKNATAIIIAIAFMLALVSCDKSEAEKERDNSFTPDAGIIINSDAGTKQGEIIGVYQYPENPAEQLRTALDSDVNSRGLSMKIGGVETIEFESREYSQIRVDFSDGSENVCLISFFNKHLEYDWDESLDGRDNPSFTMAFKDHGNSRDMITLLTSVIKYLAPDLSIEEAERLAARQDATISTDGYAQPSDIGGYQVQAQYTNPLVFAATPEFEAKLGVRIRALKQIWRGAIDTRNCQEMITAQDYELLSTNFYFGDEGNHPDIVYADFIVKNTWRDQSYIHGETWVVVDIESMTGQQYSTTLDTWAFPDAYEFGVGQRYTLFIGLNYSRGIRGGIRYAVERSESEDFNSRGEQHPLDYPTDAWYDRLWRVEPEGDGTIYNVYFILQSQTWGESFAALEGHGIGETQWPGSSPGWEGYTFVGWYDNPSLEGEPYTKDTPIYQDTDLYAKWKYSGSGGTWPRARRGEIEGIRDAETLSTGQKQTITAIGYNMNLEAPREQRFRWYPVTWRLSDGTNGSFLNEAPFRAELTIGGKGDGRLCISYVEEIYDGTYWQETGQKREVEEVAFRVD